MQLPSLRAAPLRFRDISQPLPRLDFHKRTKIPWSFPEKLTGRITVRDSRQTTVMSRMTWRWNDR